MINFKWNIIGINAVDGVVTHAKYRLTASDDVNTVETEGNWTITKTPTSIPVSDLLEKDIIQILESDMVIDGVNQVKSNLENQLAEIKSDNKIELPWLANTFTPGS